MRRAAENAMAAFFLSILVLLVFSGLRMLGVATDDPIMVQAFSSDENRAVILLRQNLENGDLNPRGFYNYGYVYHTVCYALVRLFEAAGYDADSTRTIVFVTRGVSLLSLIGVLVLFVHTLRRAVPPLHLRLGFAALLAANWAVYRWSHRTHPDLLQMLLGLSSLAVLVPRVTIPRVLASVGLAGLAFGTKAGGIYFTVIGGAAFVAERLRGRPLSEWAGQAKLIAGVGAAALLIFAGAWLASNPTIPTHWKQFERDFDSEREHIARGHKRDMDTSVADWGALLVRSFSPAGTVVLVAGLMGFVLWRGRDASEESSLPHPALTFGVAAFFVLTAGHIALGVDFKAYRYLLPVVLGMTWLAAVGSGVALARWPGLPPLALSLVLALPAANLAWKSFRSDSGNSRGFAHRYENPRLEAGRWLAASYPPETRVLLERYSYAPPDAFDEIRIVTQIRAKDLEPSWADVIVLNARKSGRWSWRRPGTRFEDLDFVRGERDGAEDVEAFHRSLFAAGSGWRVVYDGGAEVEPADDVVILERDGASVSRIDAITTGSGYGRSGGP